MVRVSLLLALLAKAPPEAAPVPLAETGFSLAHQRPLSAEEMLKRARAVTEVQRTCRGDDRDIVVCGNQYRNRALSTTEEAKASGSRPQLSSADRRSAIAHELNVCRAKGNQLCSTASIPVVTIPFGAGAKSPPKLFREK